MREWIYLCFLLSCADASGNPQVSPAPATGFIAIIIDDLGNSYERGLQTVRLPASLTLAILPHSTHGTRLAEEAHRFGKEVIIHMPMQNIDNLPLGPGGLTSHLSQDEFERFIADAIERVPWAIGLNNHMGSLLTQQELPMNWLMDEIKPRKMLFIDSRTTAGTVASTIARQKHLPSASRDVFLDNDPSLYAIDRQFRRLVSLAKQRGTAIAIGHPHATTLTYLELAIPQLQDAGIHVLPISRLLMLQQVLRIQIASRNGAGPGSP